MKIQFPELDQVLSRYPQLSVRRTENEYRVFRPSEEGKGSLWIARQKDGFRIVSTGSAHAIDRDIERLTGARAREMSDRAHKWWKSVPLSTMNHIFHYFARY